MRRFLTHAQLIDIVSKAEILDISRSSDDPGVDMAVKDLAEKIEAGNGDSIPLRDALTALSRDAMIELKAIMWFGRGDFESWEDALAEAKDHGSQGERDVVYMAEKSPLAAYLREGAKKIGENL